MEKTEKIVTLQRKVYVHQDFELFTRREPYIDYYLTTPQYTSDGVVFLIAGCGADNSLVYQAKLREYIAQNYNLSTVTVVYHCYNNRMENGAKLFLEQDDKQRFDTLMSEYAVAQSNNFLEDAYRLNAAIRQKNTDTKEIISAHLYPPNGDSQNFGVLQALDHVSVLYDLMKAQLPTNFKNVICMGSSHGGYIANLVSKIAPNSIRAVFDNSSYVTVNPIYINGSQFDYKIPELRYIPDDMQNVVMHFFTKPAWSFRDRDKNFLHNRFIDFRDFTLENQIEQMKQQGSGLTRYRMIHSETDTLIAPVKLKMRMHGLLQTHGFDTNLELIDDSRVDGKYIKTVNHGLGLSLKKMFDSFYPTLPELQCHHANDIERGSVIEYAVRDASLYRFEFKSYGINAAIVNR